MANRFDFVKKTKEFFEPSSKGVRARDIARELPGATLEVGKEIGQSIARSYGAVGAAIAGRNINEPFKPEGKIQEKIFGTKKPFSFRTIGEETLKGFGAGEKTSKKLGLGTGLLIAGLDVIPFPGKGEEESIQSLGKSLGKSILKKGLQETSEIVSRSPFVEDIARGFKYVKHEPLEIAIRENDIQTARSIREQFTGIKNAQIVRGNQLAQQIRKLIPDKLERQAMFWYKAAGGDPMVIGKTLENPKFKDVVPQLEKALNLSDKAKTALKEGERYYEESGQVSRHLDTIHGIRENYQNRIYVPEPPKDFVKSELKKGVETFTAHAKPRVFDTEFDAVNAGKKFATTDFADSLSIHNEEMARVNTAKKLQNALPDSGIAAKVSDPKDIPHGWEEVKGFHRFPQKEILVAPKGIVKGLRAITDPDYIRRIDSLRGLSKYQGLIKTVDLSYSFFHHFTMAMQTIYQGIGRDMLKLPVMGSVLERPAFKEMELDFVKHTGMTSNVEVNQDILRNLTSKNPDFFSKLTNLPGVKQMLNIADKNTEFLFGKMQRMFKVQDYGRKVANWIADNPEATENQIKTAKISFAKEVNNAYGGLNWEAMGMTKSNLSILRTLLLAPDWTISNIELVRQAMTRTAGGAIARKNLIGGIIKGMVLTEFFNKMLTGHFTDGNSKGHGLEVQVAPNVYVSFLRGGLGDLVKWSSMVKDNGMTQGTSRFLQGKLAPVPRTAIGGLSGIKYTGAPIAKRGAGPLEKDINYLEYIGQSAGPIPFGLSNEFGAKTSPFGKGIIMTGLGRYSHPKRPSRKGSNRFNF